MYTDKEQLLSCFRDMSSKKLTDIQKRTGDYRKQASMINTAIRSAEEQMISEILYAAGVYRLGNADILNDVLMITYAADIVMLESRNRVWPYEYMAFARRIGELWEPFCKKAFHYPIRPLTLIVPPVFEKIQSSLTKNIEEYVSGLDVDSAARRQLLYYYKVLWSMIGSGGTKLELDLHFSQDGIHYNCDFKSGFSSNEKGNTNRLLMVASIYHFISEAEKMIIFVRQGEEQNNHYLQTLKNSGYWEVYCADEAYMKISEFTGFDLRRWLDMNASWEQDISSELRTHLMSNDLLKYLTW
ncbi:MAG: hypothetical protein NC341_09030 [Blautia sp.]|nr:hypothetical protein [Blautia sp.]MCM1201867.1 hypothetical protein [Bacteroides fragilis]